MTDPLGAYEWVCPICNETKRSLSTENERHLRGQAKNALLRHLTSSDSVHGEEGELPPGFSERDVLDHITFIDDVEIS